MRQLQAEAYRQAIVVVTAHELAEHARMVHDSVRALAQTLRCETSSSVSTAGYDAMMRNLLIRLDMIESAASVRRAICDGIGAGRLKEVAQRFGSLHESLDARWTAMLDLAHHPSDVARCRDHCKKWAAECVEHAEQLESDRNHCLAAAGSLLA